MKRQVGWWPLSDDNTPTYPSLVMYLRLHIVDGITGFDVGGDGHSNERVLTKILRRYMKRYNPSIQLQYRHTQLDRNSEQNEILERGGILIDEIVK